MTRAEEGPSRAPTPHVHDSAVGMWVTGLRLTDYAARRS
jgi:hypothetical protein